MPACLPVCLRIMKSENQQAVLTRFTTACGADERVVAAFIGGSHATETADAHSDLDLYLITAEGAYDAFFAGRKAFMDHLGEPVFLEDFDGFGFDMLVFILANGVEGELAMASESRFQHIHGGPFKVLLDKKEILAEAVFSWQKPAQSAQQETAREWIYWFWRDLSLFVTAMARKQLWTAYGYLEAMRLKCVNLARLEQDFTSWADGYEKLEQAVMAEKLTLLQSTFCPLQRRPMIEAAHTLIQYYQGIVPSLAETHEITYPADLESVILNQLREL